MPTLHIVKVDYDCPTGFFVDNDFNAQVHCNDSHEIPDILVDIMLKHDITEVRNYFLSDDGYEKFFGEDRYCHAINFNEYTGLLELRSIKTANEETYFNWGEMIV